MLADIGRLDRGAEMRHAKELRAADNSADGGSAENEFSRKDFIAVYTKVVRLLDTLLGQSRKATVTVMMYVCMRVCVDG